MIHDPLCSNEGDPFRTGWCNVCTLIRAVREDERARYSQPSMYDEGRWAERARIKAGVEALAPLQVVVPDAVATIVNDLFSDVLAIIDGGN